MRLEGNSRVWTVLGLLLCMGTGVAIFWEVLPWGFAPVAPDAMPFFSFGHRTATLDAVLSAGNEVTPHLLYWLTFDPLFSNELTYLLDSLILGVAAVYYLRARGASALAAWIGGLALAFSGYSFTLFSAGHRGYFHMFSCAVFAFGLLVRCFEGRGLFPFAMLGCVLAWGLPYQADILAIALLLIGAYGLWLTFSRRCDPSTTPWHRIRRVYPRFLLTGVVIALIAGPMIRGGLGQQIAGRKETISSVGAPAGSGQAQANKRAQWIFATNWSLPPEDLLEFVAPCVFGIDSVDRTAPYWGRLGRAYDWAPDRRWMPNYRQHTVYLGAIQVCFALLAGLAWFFWRKQSGRPPEGDIRQDDRLLVDAPFWMIAGVVCVLLSMGRYTPFYHLFYAIPYMDLIRCPVKFHHLVEVCAAFLFGLGVEVWMRSRARLAFDPGKQDAATGGDPDPALRWAFRVTCVLAVATVLAAGVAAASRTGIGTHIAQVGFGSIAGVLEEYLVSALLRAAGLFAVAAVLLYLGRARSAMRIPGVVLASILALVVAADLATVARRYVRPMNLGPLYAQNPVTRVVQSRGGPGAGLANYVTSNDVERDWFSSALYRNGTRLTIPAPGDAGSLDSQVAQALSKRVEVFWRTTHTRFVVAKWTSAEPLVKGGILVPMLTFVPGPGVVKSAQPSTESCVVAEYPGGLPDAYVVDSWVGGMGVTNQVQAMKQDDWDPSVRTLSGAPGVGAGIGSRSIGQARVAQRRGFNLQFSTRVEVDVPQSGLLVVDERYGPDLIALLDGRETPLHPANALWCSVHVPAGRHWVSIRKRWRPMPAAVSAGTGLLVVLWGLMAGKRKKTPGAKSKGLGDIDRRCFPTSTLCRDTVQ